MIVHDINGVEHDVSRPNALDMVAMGTYFWGPYATQVEEVKPAEKIVTDVEKQEKPEVNFTSDPDAPLTPLAVLAEAVSAITVDTFLAEMTIEQLKLLSLTRYGEPIHHRSSKDTAIAKILELEADHFSE